jgi:hypothetical protein
VYGHEDHFGVKAGQLIENKMTMHRGAAHPDLKLSEEAQRGTCPVGGLAIPRGKVATVIGAMQDVELHELHGVVHMGRTPLHDTVHGGERCLPTGVSKQARKRARIAAAGGASCILRRGCWRRNHDDSEGAYYPGCGPRGLVVQVLLALQAVLARSTRALLCAPRERAKSLDPCGHADRRCAEDERSFVRRDSTIKIFDPSQISHIENG